MRRLQCQYGRVYRKLQSIFFLQRNQRAKITAPQHVDYGRYGRFFSTKFEPWAGKYPRRNFLAFFRNAA